MAAPITPRITIGLLRLPSARNASAVSESVPPSPLLSARSKMTTYFSVTTKMRDHRISDRTPKTASSVTGPESTAADSASRNA
jgi:hypothetical protein